MYNYNCVAVLGPTASGKTKLAVRIARALSGEIISADSRQVYTLLDIGTGKDLELYASGGKPVNYHLIGIRKPSRQLYLHEFQQLLRDTFHEVLSRRNVPVICGGSGLYLDALRKDFSLTQVPVNDALRAELASLNREQLLERLARYDARVTEHVDTASVKRLIRGIEVAEYLSSHKLHEPDELPYRPFYIGLKTEPAQRKIKIRARLRERLDTGLVTEAENLLAKGIGHPRLQELGLEYRYLSLYLQGALSLEEMFDQLSTAILQYSKRQMTWFRRMEKEGVRIHWIDAEEDPGELLRTLEREFRDWASNH